MSSPNQINTHLQYVLRLKGYQSSRHELDLGWDSNASRLMLVTLITIDGCSITD